MTRPNLTSVAVWLTALAAAAAFPASAQPIDLLAPPSVTAPPSPLSVTPAQPAASPPVVTYALLPGHWQLQGAQYVWVLPETVPRPVMYERLVQGHYVWRAGEWSGCPRISNEPAARRPGPLQRQRDAAGADAAAEHARAGRACATGAPPQRRRRTRTRTLVPTGEE
jgi:hypothetical protein